MHPVLLRVGEFEVHTFGLIMALAWLAASVYLDVHFKRRGMSREALSDLIF